MSATVAVVTKRAGLTLTMNSSTHRFHEIRPAPGWLDRSWVEDVVVLDLDTAEATTTALDALSPSIAEGAVVVIAAGGDGWDDVLSAHPDVIFVSLPIMPAALLSAVDRAVRHHRPRASTVVAPPAEPEAVTPVAVAPVLGAGARVEAPIVVEKAPPAVAVPVSVDPPVQPAPSLAQAVPVQQPSPPRAAPAPPSPPRPGRDTALSQVRSLLDDAQRLPRVRGVAETLRRHVVAAVGCEASVVLVRDGDSWRVAAGEHLRPLEERLQVAGDHWLVKEVVDSHHGVTITDTDIARTRLGGAPLASWPNLMALPVDDVQAFVVLARTAKAFTRKELNLARREIDTFGDQIQDAIDVRALARRMREFLDLVD